MIEVKLDYLIIQKVRKWEEAWDFMDFFSNIGVKLGLEQQMMVLEYVGDYFFVFFVKYREWEKFYQRLEGK